MSQKLDAGEVTKTLTRLQARIAERFPGSGLAGLCGDMIRTSQLTAGRVRGVSRPYLLLRLGLSLVIIGGLGAQIWAGRMVNWHALNIGSDLASLTQGLDAAVNLMLLTAGGIWFLMSLEERLKRRNILRNLHELRSYAHVIDMHQLTKDPTVILSRTPRTASSPERGMSRFLLARYLDYCAEMLALTGKLAALYAENTLDTQVIAAVNEIEILTADLGRKIWQKITILAELEEDGHRAG